MYQPPIVNFPVFSAAWSKYTNVDGASSPAVLTAGGGGAGNTGVGNKISLISFKGGSDRPSHAIACELETSPETCNCVAASDNGQLMAASFGSSVRVYACNPSGFHELADVQADHAEKESGINSIVFADRNSSGNGGSGLGARGDVLLATGGEDGVLRVWELRADRTGYDDGARGKPPSLALNLVSECTGHVQPITCVRFHPSAAVVLTASKDGTCRMWDWQRGSEAALLATTSGLPTIVQAPVVMCRSCCFSPNKANAAFSVQSGPRGSAYVTEWKYAIWEDGDGAGIRCSAEPVRVACVSPHPATTLSVRSDGKRLAVGNVEGAVLVYRLPGFAKVMEHPAHDLPVTGLGFSPPAAGVALGGYDLLAGSADYKITLFRSQGSAAILAAKQVLMFLWSLVMLLLTTIFWLLRTAVSVALTIIPIVGLLALGLALYYHPEELLAVVRGIYRGDGDTGLKGVDDIPVVV